MQSYSATDSRTVPGKQQKLRRTNQARQCSKSMLMTAWYFMTGSARKGSWVIRVPRYWFHASCQVALSWTRRGGSEWRRFLGRVAVPMGGMWGGESSESVSGDCSLNSPSDGAPKVSSGALLSPRAGPRGQRCAGFFQGCENLIACLRCGDPIIWRCQLCPARGTPLWRCESGQATSCGCFPVVIRLSRSSSRRSDSVEISRISASDWL